MYRCMRHWCGYKDIRISEESFAKVSTSAAVVVPASMLTRSEKGVTWRFACVLCLVTATR